MINYEELDSKANLGAFSTFDSEALMPEVAMLKEDDIYLGVGVDKGKSLSIARMVNPKCHIWGVDIQPNPEVPNTDFLHGDSVAMAKRWEEEDMDKISVLFIDGDHSYQGCKRDIDAWYPHMKKEGVMMFHDCDETSPGVVQAVAEFVNTHTVKRWLIFKRTDKNTSMSAIWL